MTGDNPAVELDGQGVVEYSSDQGSELLLWS